MPIRNAPSALPTTLRFMASRLAHRLRGGAAQASSPDFRTRVDATLGRLQTQVERCDWIAVRGNDAGWIDSDVTLAADASVTLLASGRVYVSRLFDVGVGPQVGLWYRVGDTPVAKMIGSAGTLAAGAGGTLTFTAKPPGEFADRDGAFDPATPRDALAGEFLVAVIRWRGAADTALEAAARIDTELFGPALQRLRTPVNPPPGWHYLWRLGQNEIYTPAKDEHALCCHTHADVGILQFPIRRPLTDASTLSWSWLVEQLPSKLPEHTQPTHDYLSIAVEFDNGLDLTWMWSCELPVDTIFQCPLPWWDQRETHWVVRSGTADLGRWVDEKRSLLADYEQAIGGVPPKEIVAVWLISNTVFQRGEGRCSYRRILIADSDCSTLVQQ